MEEQVDRLVEKVWTKFQSLPHDQRYIIAVSGVPGSGKSTLAATVSARLNTLHTTASPSTPEIAAFIPMDGYHFTRAQLSAMPDPAHAHARRGAAFTFDSSSFLSLVQSLRSPLLSSTPVISAPSFSHALKDPVANDIPIPPSTRILVFEGNYLSLGEGDWMSAAGLMDELWFVEVDFEVAAKRLIPRHVKAGIAKDEEEARKRVWENDLVNGREIVEKRMRVDEVVVSVAEESWKG
ncbi:phosphoribulokinase/uridine kinase [Calycina marina]|uniref:Phosphoribulokinase/uridine kinase n=1 Tax=Calycina marina TaxID=1763456 RepID=A0A9P8CF67_9HELO|nr:phosphoribulokinase/uridine kinase [Calycina marina]